MKHLTIVFLLLVIIACKKENNNTLEIEKTVIDSTAITKQDLSKINYIEYGIDNKAKETLDSWEAYNTVSRAIDAIKMKDFTFFNEEDAAFNVILKDLDKTIPSNIDSEPIKARLLILKTKILKLREAIQLSTISKKDRLIAIKEVFQSFSYLTLQINKKFEKEAQNIIKPDSL